MKTFIKLLSIVTLLISVSNGAKLKRIEMKIDNIYCGNLGENIDGCVILTGSPSRKLGIFISDYSGFMEKYSFSGDVNYLIGNKMLIRSNSLSKISDYKTIRSLKGRDSNYFYKEVSYIGALNIQDAPAKTLYNGKEYMAAFYSTSYSVKKNVFTEKSETVEYMCFEGNYKQAYRLLQDAESDLSVSDEYSLDSFTKDGKKFIFYLFDEFTFDSESGQEEDRDDFIETVVVKRCTKKWTLE